MSGASSTDIALYVGIALVLIWIVYRLYISFAFNNTEHFANPESSYTFTMYYADWCGHCQTAKPEFLKLGSTQTIGGKVVNIKMVNPEANPNDALGVDIRGFPTIILKNGSTSTEYPGQRTYADFLAFLQQNVR